MPATSSALHSEVTTRTATIAAGSFLSVLSSGSYSPSAGASCWVFCRSHMIVSELKSCSFGHMIP